MIIIYNLADTDLLDMASSRSSAMAAPTGSDSNRSVAATPSASSSSSTPSLSSSSSSSQSSSGHLEVESAEYASSPNHEHSITMCMCHASSSWSVVVVVMIAHGIARVTCYSVIKLIMQFLKENNLLTTLRALQVFTFVAISSSRVITITIPHCIGGISSDIKHG